MPDVIARFEGEYFFLSNFYPAEFVYRAVTYPTVEHAFQAAKTRFVSNKKVADEEFVIIASSPSPQAARRRGREVPGLDVAAWDEDKDRIMRTVVFEKFRQAELYNELMLTGCSMLVEGNNHGDTYWGRVNGKGLNKLGVILMETRGYWLNSPPF